MSDAKGFDTLQIHGGAAPDPATGARQVPIYQSTAFVFRDAAHAAALFGLKEVGYIYSRLTNPTIAALQTRIAMLEGGAGAVCCSSGHAAQIMALFPLMGPGRNIVASSTEARSRNSARPSRASAGLRNSSTSTISPP
jgi:O-acetylhomoserine (thiol)-lyase